MLEAYQRMLRMITRGSRLWRVWGGLPVVGYVAVMIVALRLDTQMSATQSTVVVMPTTEEALA